MFSRMFKTTSGFDCISQNASIDIEGNDLSGQNQRDYKYQNYCLHLLDIINQ